MTQILLSFSSFCLEYNFIIDWNGGKEWKTEKKYASSELWQWRWEEMGWGCTSLFLFYATFVLLSFLPKPWIFSKVRRKIHFLHQCQEFESIHATQQMNSLHFSLPSMEESFSLWIIKNFIRWLSDIQRKSRRKKVRTNGLQQVNGFPKVSLHTFGRLEKWFKLDSKETNSPTV